MTSIPQNLTPWENIRRCAHQDTNRNLTTWPHALTDAQARGYGTGRTYDGTSSGQGELTSVEAAADCPDFATAWIAELGDLLLAFGCSPLVQYTDGALIHDSVDGFCLGWPQGANGVLRRWHYLAETALTYWPDPPKSGQVVGGVTVGARGGQGEVCGLCGAPVVSGRDEAGNSLLRRDKDGTPFHATAASGGGIVRPACFWVVWRQRRSVA